MRALTASILVMVALLLAAYPAGSQTISAQAPTQPGVRRALVLGGGGVTGLAWETGLLKGLRDAGVDLTEADLIVGTSAGAILGARIRAGRTLDELYDGLVAPPGPRVAPERIPARAPGAAAGSGVAPLGPLAAANRIGVDLDYFHATTRMWQGIDTTPALRMDVGGRALAAAPVISEEAWVQLAAANLGVAAWPSGPLQITAIDVTDGSTRLFDRTQGVPVERAVAASTALPGLIAPITSGDRRYMDGGVGGAHLHAVGSHDLIVAITVGSRSGTAREPDEPRARGRLVMHLAPDPESATARGTDSLDGTRRRPSAEAGLRQAALVAADLYEFWNGTSPGR